MEKRSKVGTKNIPKRKTAKEVRSWSFAMQIEDRVGFICNTEFIALQNLVLTEPQREGT